MARGVDMEKLKARLEALNNSGNGGSGSGVTFIDIKDGRNVVRILPAKEGAEDFYQEVRVHYGVGKTETNKKGTMVVCPTTFGDSKPCPVCETSKELRKLSKAKDDSYDKQAKDLYRKSRVYFNAIDCNEDLSVYQKNADGKWINTADENKEQSPVKVLGTGIGVFKDVIKLICDPEYGDITDPDNGLDVIITKTGNGRFNTEYDVKTVRKESAVSFEAWEECLHDLSQFAKVKTYKELVDIVNGDETPTDSGGNDEPEQTPDKDDTPEPTGTESEGGDALQNEITAALNRRRSK